MEKERTMSSTTEKPSIFDIKYPASSEQDRTNTRRSEVQNTCTLMRNMK